MEITTEHVDETYSKAYDALGRAEIKPWEDIAFTWVAIADAWATLAVNMEATRQGRLING